DFLKRKPAAEPASPPAPHVPAAAATKHLPKPRPAAEPRDPAARNRLDQLRKRREMVAFDLERAEAAHRPDNPWTERMALLDDSLATIEADQAALDASPREAPRSLPPVPIADIAARPGPEAAVEFTIGDEPFAFVEATDWDQRGGPVVRGQLQQEAGDAAALVPATAPPDRRQALADHLAASIAAFATDLRDRALEGEPLPANATLADLAEPCPVCGNWREWGGVCPTCARRAYQRQQLEAEAVRIARERDAEAEDRHLWAERLPVARRRLADVDAEIARLLRG
ncbi:MAG TPA: hypothetical protein VFU81_00415, partial [Thermomicrobiales bacterium]|nr:hypothetical protein [Thermomicrobiales bacterium]